MYLDTNPVAGQAVLPASPLPDLPLPWRIVLAEAATALDRSPDPVAPGLSLTELCALARDW
jgi:hypothetical protein